MPVASCGDLVPGAPAAAIFMWFEQHVPPVNQEGRDQAWGLLASVCERMSEPAGFHNPRTGLINQSQAPSNAQKKQVHGETGA